MSTTLDSLIVAATCEQLRETGTYDPFTVAEEVFASIDPADYAETLRLIISQRVAVGTPLERSTTIHER